MSKFPLFKPIGPLSFKSYFNTNTKTIITNQTKFFKNNLATNQINKNISKTFNNDIILKSSFINKIKYNFRSFNPSLAYQKFSIQQSISRLSRNSYSSNGRYHKNIRWNKLIRPGLFTLVFCLGTTILVPPLFKYTPLAIFKKNPSSLVYTIMGINGIIFLLWKSPQFQKVLRTYFLMIKETPSNWSMIGSAFSHQSLGHLAVNMFVLQSFGTSLCAMIGVSNFLVMYLNSAVISSFFSLLIPVILRNSLAVGSLGASGAIFSVFGTFAYLIPKAPIALFFVPVPGGAWFLFLGSIVYNIAGIGFKWGAQDFSAHIGGCVAGLLYGFYFNRIKEQIMKRRRRSVYF